MNTSRYHKAVGVALLGLLWLLPLAAAAQVEEARVHIDGMV